MRYDLIIKNGTLVTSTESFLADIAVKDGKIASVAALQACDSAEETFDAKGLFILPGIIDAHVHFRDPGLTEKEDFETGSMAAAMGGVTLIADMPNVIPVTSTAERFKEKVKIASEKSYVDFALFALLNDENLNEMEGLKNAGALGFKVFLGTSTGEIASPSLSVLARQLKESARLNLRVGFHCENSELNSYFTNLWKDRKDVPQGLVLSQSRPVFSEVLATREAICFAQYTNAKIHIHHITCKDAADAAKEAKKKGIDITAETCPHYLFFNADDHVHKVYPPIRGKEQGGGLWDAVKNGTIDIIATDHAPHTAEEKSRPLNEMPGGLSGVETSVSLMLNEANKGTITLNDYVRLASENPAKTWGIYPQKGSAVLGTDADFTIADINKKWKIDVSKLHSKSKTSPFDGMEVKGIPLAAIVRGKFVMRERELTGKKGRGNLIRKN